MSTLIISFSDVIQHARTVALSGVHTHQCVNITAIIIYISHSAAYKTHVSTQLCMSFCCTGQLSPCNSVMTVHVHTGAKAAPVSQRYLCPVVIG